MKAHSVFVARTCLYFFILFIVACAEQPPPLTDKASFKGFSAEQSHLRLGVRALGAWSSPVEIDNEIVTNTTAHMALGPKAVMNASGQQFLSWQLFEDFDANSGQYQLARNKVLYNDSNNGWQSSLPFRADQASLPSSPQFQYSQNGQYLYALWQVQEVLMFNQFESANGWGTPREIGQTQGGWLKVHDNQAHVFWMTALGSGSRIDHQLYDPTVSWMPPRAIQSDQVILKLSQPMRDSLQIHFVALQATNTGGFALTHITQAIDDTVNVNIVENLNPGQNITHLFFHMNPHNNQLDVVYVKRMEDQSQTILHRHFNGVWSESTTLDQSMNDYSRLDGQIDVTMDDAGKLTIVWFKYEDDGAIIRATPVAVEKRADQSFTPAAALSSPVFIRSSGSGVENNANELFSLHVQSDSNQQLAVIWVQQSNNLSELFFNQQSPTSIWPVPDVISTYAANNTTINGASVVVNANDKHVYWLTGSDVGNDRVYSLNHSESLGRPGTPVTPNPLDPGATKPSNHLLSSDVCEACHLPTGLTQVEHAEVIGTCVSCHNSVIAGGKTEIHITTTDMCDACHSVITWMPVIYVDHTQVLGSCNSCHTQVVNHISTTQICEACHTVTIWIPVLLVDHNEVMGLCFDCHNNVIAAGKSATHEVSSDNCAECHNTVSWLLSGATPPPSNPGGPPPNLPPLPPPNTGPIDPTQGLPANHINTTLECLACHVNGTTFVPFVDHAQVIGTCAECHNGTVARGQPSYHIATTTICEACHQTINWIPVLVDHTQLLGTCVSCHSKPVNHIIASDECNACHQVDYFVPVIAVDHNQVIGSCFDCHNGMIATGKSATHVPSSEICEECHATTHWIPALNNGVPGGINGSDLWQRQAMVSSYVLNTQREKLHGPIVAALGGQQAALSIVKHSNFNPITGRFNSSQSELFSLDVNTQAWLSDAPIAQNDLQGASIIKTIAGDGQNYQLYALWKHNDLLYFSGKNNAAIWDLPLTLGAVYDDFQLLKQADQTLCVIWTEKTATGLLLNARRLSAGNVWSGIFSTPIETGSDLSLAVENFSQQVAVLAYQHTAGANTIAKQVQVQLFELNAASGWVLRNSQLSLSETNLKSAQLSLAFTTDNRPLVVGALVQNIPLPSLSIVYTQLEIGSNQWSALQRIGRSENQANFLASPLRLKFNRNGNILLAWSQVESPSLNQVRFKAYSNQFDPQSNQWSGADYLGSLFDRFEGSVDIVQRADGSAMAIWSTLQQNNSILSARRFDLQNGWTATSEIIAGFDLTNDGQIKDTVLQFSGNDIYATWAVSQTTASGEQVTAWTASSAF